MHTRNGPPSGSAFLEPPESASYDALADLFLGPAGESAHTVPAASSLAVPAARGHASAAPTARPAAPFSVELLVMGHLPIRSNPWAAQYARAVADRAAAEHRGPVALLRAVAGEAWIDLFGVPPAQREAHHHDSLESALRHARAVASHWIVQCDETDPAQPSPIESAQGVTLLCAGNEAAVLAAFQSLKSLAAALERRPNVALRVGVMGAEPAAAESIGDRLRQSADLFLKRRVDAAPSVGKMGPTGGAAVYRGPATLGVREMLEIASAAPATAAVPAPDSFTPPACTSIDAPHALRPVPARVGAAAVAAPVPGHTAEGRSEPSRPLRAIASNPPAAPACRSLAERLPGAGPLAFRCPDAPSVEFARGHDGTLHLLLSSEGPEALHALTTAHAWAEKNIETLRLLTPGLDPERALLHLFTASPKRLRGLLDSRVRVHLLAGVEVEGKTGWCCVELN